MSSSPDAVPDTPTDSPSDVTDRSPDYAALIARTAATRFQPGNQQGIRHVGRWSLTHSLSLAQALKQLETHKGLWSCHCRPQCRHYALHFLRRGLKSDSVLVAVAKKFWPDITASENRVSYEVSFSTSDGATMPNPMRRVAERETAMERRCKTTSVAVFAAQTETERVEAVEREGETLTLPLSSPSGELSTSCQEDT